MPRRGIVVATALVAASLFLVGCGPVAEVQPAQPSASAPTASAEPSPTVASLLPEGTASDNLLYFSSVVSAVWAGQQPAQGLIYIDALTAAGFDRAAMQATNDLTTLGTPAESIQFSVLWGSECLIGQAGPEIPTPVVVVLPALASGGCLVGDIQSF